MVDQPGCTPVYVNLLYFRENGKLVKIVTVRGGWKKLLAALRKIKHPFVICYEASCGYGALYDALRKIARRVVVAHPGQLRLIFRSKNKNDRSDAKKLATLLFLDQVPTVHVPGQDVRGWQWVIEFRTRVIAIRVRVKNAFRALLRGQVIGMPRGTRLWTRAGLAWLATVALQAARDPAAKVAPVLTATDNPGFSSPETGADANARRVRKMK